MFLQRKSRKQRVEEFYQSSKEASPLYTAICNNDLTQVHDLITSSPNLLLHNVGYGTPLHVSIFCDNLEVVSLLLDAGADLLAPSNGLDDRADALTIAAREGKQPFLYQLLKHVKLPQSSQIYKNLQYCFLESAAWGQVASVANLMRWWDGWTLETKKLALNSAAQRWKVYVAEFLVSKAKFDQKALDTALAHAIDYKVYMTSTNEYCIDYEGVDYFEQHQLVKLLLHAGANPSMTHFGIPLVIYTAQNINLIGALRVPLENGADPNTTDKEGKSALQNGPFGIDGSGSRCPNNM